METDMTTSRISPNIVDELRQTAGNLIKDIIENSEITVTMLTDAANEIERLHATPSVPASVREALPTLSEIKKIALTVKPDGIQDGLSHIVRLCIDAGSAPPAQRNWPEDAGHENGNYECLCVECEQPFIGHKRRVLCKSCSSLLRSASLPAPDVASQPRPEDCATADAICHFPACVCVGVKGNIVEPDGASRDAVIEAARNLVDEISTRGTHERWKSLSRSLADVVQTPSGDGK
jgi:hypothetical protein